MAWDIVRMMIFFVIVFVVLLGVLGLMFVVLGPSMSAVVFDFFGSLGGLFS